MILLRDEHEPPGQALYALQRGDRMRGPITLPSGAAAARPLGLLTYRGSWLGRIAVLSGIAYLLLSSPSVSVAQERQGTEATSGRQVFNNLCRTCHSTKEGDNRLGPHLHRIIGRKAGSLPNYGYSSAMKGAVGAASRSRKFSMEIALPPVRTVSNLRGRVTESKNHDHRKRRGQHSSPFGPTLAYCVPW